MHRLIKASVGMAAAAGLIGGTFLVASAGDDPPPPSTGGVDLLSEEAITADWCTAMTPVFNADDGYMPDVEATATAMIDRSATPTDTTSLEAAQSASNPNAATTAGYLALLEGEPAAIASDYSFLRNAGRQAIGDEPITNADAVLAAARSVDGFIADTCEPGT